VDRSVTQSQIKHWMDPRIIPYGWGQFSQDEEILVMEKGEGGMEREEAPSMAMAGLLVNPSTLAGLIQGGGSGVH
jgi:hypothetical protein